MVWFLLGKKENQNLSKTCHSLDKCCQRNNMKSELEVRNDAGAQADFLAQEEPGGP